MMKRIYECAPCCNNCPVVDHDTERGIVAIHDPAKPEKGRVELTVEEYNALITGAKPIGA